ncbi:MAG: lysylphosphatidylglycerol synthase transmembrane domain-containing protein [Anaerolineales bacterium]
MKKRANLIGFTFALIVIIYIVTKLDWQVVLQTFTQLDFRWLAAAFGVYLINYVFRSLRFQTLLNLGSVPFRHLFGITNLYGMYLYLMPAKSGELSFPLLVKNRLNVPLPESTAILITARFFDFATVALFLPFVLVFFWDMLHPWVRIVVFLFIGGVFLIGVGFIWLVRQPARTQRLQQIHTADFHPLVFRLWNSFIMFIQSMQAIDQRKQYVRNWLITIIIWFCVQTTFYFIVLSLGESLSFYQMIVVSIIMIPMTLLPIQGFANLGTHEIGWVAAFSLFGYPETNALKIAVSSHIILLLFVLLLGSLGLILIKKPKQI